MAATIRIPTIFTAKDKYTRVVTKMTKGVKRFAKTGISSIQRFDNKVSRSFKKIGRLGALVGGLTLGTLFSTAIQGNIAFNDSLASVSAITGATGQDLVNLEMLAKNTAKETKKAGADVLKAYELVGSAKPELLENAAALDGVTRSVITLSKASRMDLESSTKSLTDVMNQFNLKGKESGKTIDILAAGAKFGAAAIPQISESIVQFGTVAKQSNVSLMESVAAIEVFASKGIKGAEAGTKMRNVLTTMATAKALPKKALKEMAKFGVNLDIVSNKALPLNVRLKEMSKISGSATAMVKVFGKENQGAGAILLNNIDTLNDLTAKVNENGVASIQAKTNTNTFAFALESIKNSFINTTTATNSNNTALDAVKNTMFWVGENMGTVLGIAGSLVGVLGLVKAVSWGVQAATWAKNTALGVNIALNQKGKKALIGNKAAMVAYKVAMGISTAWTWLATTATTAFGIALNLGLWPILAIIAAIVAVVLVIKNWSSITDWFGKKWGQFTGWISEAWTNVIKFFSEFDFGAMFKSIGQSILTFMLLPLKTMLFLLSKLPGKVGNLAKMGLDKISEVTGQVTVNPEDGDGGGVLPSTTQASNENVSRSISEKNSSVRLDIVDKGGNVGGVTNDDNVPISIGSTVGAF